MSESDNPKTSKKFYVLKTLDRRNAKRGDRSFAKFLGELYTADDGTGHFFSMCIKVPSITGASVCTCATGSTCTCSDVLYDD
jgi:hypothetical protein